MTVCDIDIWRAAKLMVDQYGKNAAMEATLRSNRASKQSDRFNYEVWQRVAMAILDLQRKKVLEGESVH